MDRSSQVITVRRVPPFLIVFGVMVAIFLAIASFGVYTIESGKIGVLTTFGEYSDVPKEPGIHFKIPFIQTVKVMDVKMQTANYQNESNFHRNNGVVNQPRITVLDSKNLNIGIDATVQFSPDSQQAKVILSKYGLNYFDKLIGPIIRDTIREVVSQYQAEDIARERSKIAAHLNNAMRENFQGLPFSLQAVQLRNIELPKIVRDKIEEVQLAKQEEHRLMMIKKQVKEQQGIQTIEANTRLIEITTRAKADAEQKKIGADAEAYLITVQAEAQAKANALIRESLDAKGLVVKYKEIQKWDGKYPHTMIGDKSGVMLQLPNAS